MSLLTSALNNHININQNMTMNLSSVFFSLETTYLESLADKLIEYGENAYVRIRSKFNTNSTTSTTVSLHVCFVSLFQSFYLNHFFSSR